MIRKRCVLLIVLLMLAILLAGCGVNGEYALTVTAPPTEERDHVPTSTPATDEQAVRQLIEAEAVGVVAQDLELLMSLWAEDPRVVDAKHTPEDESDDLVWQGWYAVRDRYITLVFPGAASSARPTDLQIQIEGDRAVVISTPIINDEISPAGDRWTLVRTTEGWRIESLTYNLESP